MSFMGEEVKNPRRVIPRSLLVAGVVITLGYLVGTVAMLVALPSSSISGLGGFMTAIDFLCRRLGVGAMVAPVAILVAMSNVGAAAAYLTATARLPFVAGINHYLPSVFGRIHPNGIHLISRCFPMGWLGCYSPFLGRLQPVKGAYDVLVSMSVLTYFIPYLFLFGAMIRVQGRPSAPDAIRLPWGRRLAIPLACLGFFSTTAAIILALFPAEDERNPSTALFKILAMTCLLLLAGVAIYRRGQRLKDQASAQVTVPICNDL